MLDRGLIGYRGGARDALGVALAGMRSASNPYAGYAEAMDFDSQNYNVGGTNYPAIASIPGYTFTRSGAVSFTNLAGGIDNFATGVPAINDRGYHSYGALTNLLLNAGSSSVLVTQTTAALTAVAHTISFIGTGSVALSGAFVGSLAGTSATNQVLLNFTPTAAALTVTVTGDVRFSGLMAATLSGAVPIIATGATMMQIGAGRLEQSVTVPDGDYFIWGAMNFSASPTSYRMLATLSDASNAWKMYFSTLGTAVEINSGAVTHTAGTVGAGRVIIGLRRKAGKFTAISRWNGVTTIGLESGPLAQVAGIAKIFHGEFLAGNFTQGPVEGLFRKVGTLTDADITALAV